MGIKKEISHSDRGFHFAQNRLILASGCFFIQTQHHMLNVGLSAQCVVIQLVKPYPPADKGSVAMLQTECCC